MFNGVDAAIGADAGAVMGAGAAGMAIGRGRAAATAGTGADDRVGHA